MLGLLFKVSGWKTLDQAVAVGSRREDFAGLEIEGDGLGALRTAIDTERDHGK
jgi:hypothetical protein